jgi:mono/diheme cytochrome c family protein
MFAQFEAEGRPIPSLSSAEVSDLFAFFYASLYFSPKGEAARGRNVFEEKSCISCHSEVLNTRSRRSLLPSWTDLRDPVVWAERMWNHAGEMDSAIANRGLSWPRLTAQEIADLLTFLSASPGMQQQAEFTVGEAELGRVAFERSCE